MTFCNLVENRLYMNLNVFIFLPGSDGAAADSLDLSSFITEESWRRELETEFTKDYFKGIQSKLAGDYANNTQVFPPKDRIFHAFNVTPFDEVKVVIVGQDPYHADGQAMGLAFSVPLGVEPPPSLKNIYKELTNDDEIKDFKTPTHAPTARTLMPSMAGRNLQTESSKLLVRIALVSSLFSGATLHMKRRV
ncbi:Uracil-DNA glycosylase [Mizuhopecten yessoensis]|uniref:Uracil-DNA glycosylase n=1 Tax=Mizuhopecten yessoensis TaxID=6573 RepID=A0A210PWS4_MIZYE|nr:Uracil-DNA glycosylase [Mizuhopecten yessoensis]